MSRHNYYVKVLIAVGLFLAGQTLMSWRSLMQLGEDKMSLEAETQMLERKRDNLIAKIHELERSKHRLALQEDKLDLQVRDLLPLNKERLHLPFIFFITPTKKRPAQKADLVRLLQTLSYVPNLIWIIVEDSESQSASLDDLVKTSKVKVIHLNAETPENMRMTDKDPNWKKPRGVIQRNTALEWIRTNYMSLKKGIVYFGDDDNVYSWELFDEMRKIKKVGIWPVGLVGGQLVETAVVQDGKVLAFNASWKNSRPFPIDMAGFAINITLLHDFPKAEFSFEVPRGYQESHFLSGLNLTRSSLEPLADYCTRVLVWHTRTEKTKLQKTDYIRFGNKKLTDLEKSAVI
ncbi:unnamed protein product [Bursaphelenchus xylophilus]|uniref:Galactosylgalactosylxylosylprotein 3-beta-glucuronosyltransferase n=1 Tax=Bursaphelenchus xylophilus TaxID=6326 RepID=A0A1I7SW75_BURXY|nr:unnamed protein product [Bursaphelenchus xylophilus]CAG9098942.1 unnamed protein product [Bursaphelenchus xylophilus]